MKSKEGIIKILKGIKGELKKYRVKKIGVFGSVIRGEQQR
jgi:predicted nucleotidyltransferase